MKITFESKLLGKRDTIVVFVSENGVLTNAAKDLDNKINGLIKSTIKAEGFKGKVGSFISIVSPHGVSVSRIILAGIGKTADINSKLLEKIGSGLFTELNKKSEVIQALPGFSLKGFSDEEVASLIATGMSLNSYRFNKHFTKNLKNKSVKIKSVSFIVSSVSKAKKIFNVQSKMIDAVFLARDLVTEAPNILYPESYANIIKKQLAPLGIEVKVLNRAQIKKLGMGALEAVGKGSVREEKLVTMHYKGGSKSQKNIAFVGKGITFDTGGISLKPGAGMGDMKFDMGGSATVVGLMKLLAGRKAKANVIGVVALAENMPAGNACRPGDVIKTMSGQTVEILNTDAEGRLVLCDALWYVQEKFKPTQIIDLATLTGAMLIALGHEYAGAFSNDDKMPKDLMKVGSEVGEEVWQMPLCDAWNKEINSPIADMKNTGNGKSAGSATAAHFLKRFIKSGVKWTHLDIAGTAWRSLAKPSTPKGATGFGVRLLDRYVEKFCEK